MPHGSQSAGSDTAGSAPPKARNLTDLFDLLAHEAKSELGGIGQTVFFLGDGIQRAATDFAFDLFSPKTWSPEHLWRMASNGAKQSVQISKLANPQNLALAWEELKNKIEVFTLVIDLPTKLGLPPAGTGEFIPLAQLVPRAYSVPPFQALWAVEGLGHYYADSYYAHFGNPQSLLSEAQAQVPAKSLLMLHAGMGLSFADRLLGNLTPDDPSPGETHAMLEEFVSLCRNNSREGYLGAAVESLGLETRDFYPGLLDVVHQQLLKIAPELVGFFWHGAGRALYFSRKYFLPALTTAWSGIAEETRNCPDQLSAMAGLAWAIALVNMRQPTIMENMLRSYVEDSQLGQGFINGVASSLIMRQDTTPSEPFVAAFYQHRPANDSQLATIWENSITAPAQAALQTYYPVLQQNSALDQVFRYQDLAALTIALQNKDAQEHSGKSASRK